MKEGAPFAPPAPVTPLPRSVLSLPLAALLALASGCAHLQGAFTWVDELPSEAAPEEVGGYVIAHGDVLSVRVWNEEGMSARPRVREDGQISLPFLNDVKAVGLTPAVLAQQLQARLKQFISNPGVAVALEERQPVSVSVLGQVTEPGAYTLEPGRGVLHALAQAKGLTQFASEDRIFVLRKGFQGGRIRFRYDKLTRAEGRSATFRLQSGDVVVVE